MNYLIPIGCLLLAYVLGSIPTGFLVAKTKGIDIREHGSGSTGATNVWRTIGKKEGIFVWLIDSAKGYGVVWLVVNIDRFMGNESLLPYKFWLVVCAAFLALLGHSRSVWIGFKGGKSVATSLGILFAFNPIVAGTAFGIWLGTMVIWRTVSLSSILAAVSTPVLIYFFDDHLPYLLFAIVGGVFVIWRHSSNIERILEGTEPQLSFGAKELSP